LARPGLANVAHACLFMGVDRNYRGHRGTDAIDPLRTFVVRCPPDCAAPAPNASQRAKDSLTPAFRIPSTNCSGLGEQLPFADLVHCHQGRLSRRPADVIRRGAFRNAGVWTALFGSAHTGVTVRWVTSHRTTGCHAACFIHIPDFLAERP